MKKCIKLDVFRLRKNIGLFESFNCTEKICF